MKIDLTRVHERKHINGKENFACLKQNQIVKLGSNFLVNGK